MDLNIFPDGVTIIVKKGEQVGMHEIKWESLPEAVKETYEKILEK